MRILRPLRLLAMAVAAVVMTATAVLTATAGGAPEVVLGGDGSVALPSTSIAGLVPGDRQTVAYLVRLEERAAASHVSLAVTSPQVGQPCSESSCAGRLVDVLQVDAHMSDAAPSAACVASSPHGPMVLPPTSVRDLSSHGPVRLLEAPFAPGHRACLRIGVELPDSADSAASGQQLDLRLTISATEDLGRSGVEPITGVGGVATEHQALDPPAPMGAGSRLPITGVASALLLASGVGGLAAGGLALRTSRRARPSPTLEDRD